MRILITGAAAGIGAEAVKLFKADGHHVTAFDISEPPLVDHWVQVDLSQPAEIDRAVDAVTGSFDVLINNAGLPPRAGNQYAVLAVNFMALRQVTQRMISKLVDGARIVNTASRAGLMWHQNVDEVKALFALSTNDDLNDFITRHKIDEARAYNLSKEAVIAYTKSITTALLSRNIRANSVSPAPVATAILDDFMAVLGDRAAAALALPGRAATPQEVAQVIYFLASENSSWIKGHDVLVDGGVSAMVSAQELNITLVEV